MKIAMYILIALLLATLGAGAYFFLTIHTPIAEEHARMKAGLPELDRAKVELKKVREREKKETAWLAPAMETLKSGLAEEIGSGNAEIVMSGGMIVINIAERTLYTPDSVTFAKSSPPVLMKLASLLKSANDIKDKDIYIGNTTHSVPTRGRGRKRVPGKEGRDLAADRSFQLVKYLEKNGVPSGALIAAAYPEKMHDRAFKIKDRKAIIVIANPVAAAPEAAAAPKAEAKPGAGAATAAPAQQQKPIPISPAPKTGN